MSQIRHVMGVGGDTRGYPRETGGVGGEIEIIYHRVIGVRVSTGPGKGDGLIGEGHTGRSVGRIRISGSQRRHVHGKRERILGAVPCRVHGGDGHVVDACCERRARREGEAVVIFGHRARDFLVQTIPD